MVRFLAGKRDFSFPKHPARVWCPPKPPLYWVFGALSPGIKAAIHAHLVPRLRMHGSTLTLPYTPFGGHKDGSTFTFASDRIARQIKPRLPSTSFPGYYLTAFYRTKCEVWKPSANLLLTSRAGYIVTKPWTGWPRNRASVPSEGRDFFCSPHYAYRVWVKRRGMKLSV